MNKFKPFQIRWREVLKHGDVPYLYRWTFIFFGFSIRIHHWIGNDVGPHFHDHATNFISFLFKGEYTNVTPAEGRSGYAGPNSHWTWDKLTDCLVHKRRMVAPAIWWVRGTAKHRLEIPKEGAWTILFCGRPYRKWGFWVNNHLWRPLRYFHKYGD